MRRASACSASFMTLNAFRAARQQRGLSRLEVASLAGVFQSVLGALESGKNTNPSWDVLSRLSQVYHRRPQELIPPVRLPVSAGVIELFSQVSRVDRAKRVGAR
jgi:transcriptional regulator with XRE-family HTH domain